MLLQVRLPAHVQQTSAFYVKWSTEKVLGWGTSGPLSGGLARACKSVFLAHVLTTDWRTRLENGAALSAAKSPLLL